VRACARRRDMFARVAVCCSVLQCVAVCCSVLQCVAARYVCSQPPGESDGGGTSKKLRTITLFQPKTIRDHCFVKKTFFFGANLIFRDSQKMYFGPYNLLNAAKADQQKWDRT